MSYFTVHLLNHINHQDDEIALLHTENATLREVIDDAMEYVRYGENPGLYTRMRDVLKKRAPDTISLGLDGSRVLKKGETNE